MGARDVINRAAEDIAQEFEDATYTPSGGDPVSYKAWVWKAVEPQPSGYDSQAWEQGITISALLSELGQEPDRGDTFLVDGTTYKVLNVAENNGITMHVNVEG